MIIRIGDEGTSQGIVLDEAEAELVSALLMLTKLGSTGYEKVAYDLITRLENQYGEDFITDAVRNVYPRFAVQSIMQHVQANFTYHDVTIEVAS